MLCAEGEEQVSKFGCYVSCWIATSLALKSLQQPVGGSSGGEGLVWQYISGAPLWPRCALVITMPQTQL